METARFLGIGERPPLRVASLFRAASSAGVNPSTTGLLDPCAQLFLIVLFASVIRSHSTGVHVDQRSWREVGQKTNYVRGRCFIENGRPFR